jgi:hypothetical protein
MTGYTANLDTFAMSRHNLAFNGLAMVDGVLVGLDDTGAFALDGTTDDGAAITGQLETGWTNFAEFNQNPNVSTDTQKRITGLFIQATGSDSMDVEFWAAEKTDSDTVDLSGLVDAQGDEPIPYRVVPPQGMQAVAWKFLFSGIGRWKMAAIRIVFDVLKRSR